MQAEKLAADAEKQALEKENQLVQQKLKEELIKMEQLKQMKELEDKKQQEVAWQMQMLAKSAKILAEKSSAQS
jgi:hypothetical protein